MLHQYHALAPPVCALWRAVRHGGAVCLSPVVRAAWYHSACVPWWVRGVGTSLRAPMWKARLWGYTKTCTCTSPSVQNSSWCQQCPEVMETPAALACAH